MVRYQDQAEKFLNCKKDGKFMIIETVDSEIIKTMFRIAQGDITAANILKKNAQNESSVWNSIYKLYYDALHELTEAYLL